MDTTGLVVGQIVEIVIGDRFWGEGSVIQIMPYGVKVEIDTSSPMWLEIDQKKVYSFDHDGKECDEKGVKGGEYELKLPDK